MLPAVGSGSRADSTPPVLLPQAGEGRGVRCASHGGRAGVRTGVRSVLKEVWSGRPDLAPASLSALADLTQPVHLEPVPFDLEVQSARQPSKKRLDIASLE